MEFMLLLHVSILVLTIAMIVMGGVFYHKASARLNDAGVDRVTAILGEMQQSMLDIDKRFGGFEEQIRYDLDMIHKRLEYLEEQDRKRK